MSTAILTAAAPVRLPVRVWSMYSLPRSIGELHVLHVFVVLLELLGDAVELVVDLGHIALHLGDRLRRADAGDHVLALRVDQVLAVELFSPVDGSRVKATPVR